ncbi:hypothetical protein BD560DRAFT_435526 [Blakeslea trispora]|nr:hypothetical protein BD560DRAFT_435526 [Blakeslea trispora]
MSIIPPQLFVSSELSLERKGFENQKRYSCDQCQKQFTRPSALQTHVYTHTGEKPHVCDIVGCGRRFAVISNLRRHLRIHKPTHIRRRLTAQERRVCVERLIQKSGGMVEDHNNYYGSHPSKYYIFSSASSCSSGSPSPKLSPTTSPTTSPLIESNVYRFIKPKETRPLPLTVKYLLSNNTVVPQLPTNHRLTKPKQTRSLYLSVKNILN